MGEFFFNILMYFLKEYLFLVFIRDLSFGILFIRKLHQIHFVFLLILHLFYLPFHFSKRFLRSHSNSLSIFSSNSFWDLFFLTSRQCIRSLWITYSFTYST